MSGYWKIPKEWVTEFGLSGNEALVLADILEWPNITLDKRAERTNTSRRGVVEIVKRLKSSAEIALLISAENAPKDTHEHSAENAPKIVQKMHQNSAENALSTAKEKENYPTPPKEEKENNNIYNNENQESQEKKGENGADFALHAGKTEQQPPPVDNSFVPPTIEEIKNYCAERANNIDAEAFFQFYESNGWKVGKKPMKKWKAAIITWEKRNGGGVNKTTIQIAEGWKVAYLKKFGYSYKPTDKKPIAAFFASCENSITETMREYNQKDVKDFCERMFFAMLNVADDFELTRWSPDFTTKHFNELYRKIIENKNTSNNGKSNSNNNYVRTDEYSAELLAELHAALNQ